MFYPRIAEKFYGFVATHPTVHVDPESVLNVLPNIRAVAFDFDHVIAVVDAYKQFRGTERLETMLRMTDDDIADQMFGGTVRVDRLRKMFQRLARNGIKLWICSFSLAAVIRLLLQRVGLDFETYFQAPLIGRMEMSTSTAQASKAPPATHRKALERYYSKVKPEKVKGIGKILDDFAGREKKMYSQIEEQCVI